MITKYHNEVSLKQQLWNSSKSIRKFSKWAKRKWYRNFIVHGWRILPVFMQWPSASLFVLWHQHLNYFLSHLLLESFHFQWVRFWMVRAAAGPRGHNGPQRGPAGGAGRSGAQRGRAGHDENQHQGRAGHSAAQNTYLFTYFMVKYFKSHSFLHYSVAILDV